MYTVTIADVAELTEEVTKVMFSSATPDNSDARSSSIGVSLTITGRVAYDADKLFMKDSTKAIAEWSTKKPDSPDTYKEVTVIFNHTGAKRKYVLSHAFVVSFTEQYEDQNGFFELVVKQKKDRLDEDSVTFE